MSADGGWGDSTKVMNAASFERGPSMPRAQAVKELHALCGVYTAPLVASAMLDLAGWQSGRNLVERKFLEPAAGEGAILVPAIERLLEEAESRGVAFDALGETVRSYEIVSSVAKRLRNKVRELLLSRGASKSSAHSLAKSWVITGDFLLAGVEPEFDTVVSNPPYVRAGKIPVALKERYSRAGLPSGDMSHLFSSAIAKAATNDGTAVLLISDRWLNGVHGGRSRTTVVEGFPVIASFEMEAGEVFVKKVSAYPVVIVLDRRPRTIIGAKKSASVKDLIRTAASAARHRGVLLEAPTVLPKSELRENRFWERLGRWPTLMEQGAEIKCGTALGLKRAFLISSDKAALFDKNLVLPYIDQRDLGRRPTNSVLVTYDQDGFLDLRAHPAVKNHLWRWKTELSNRSCVTTPETDWHRTIDRIDRVYVSRPKLLIAGVAKESRIYIERPGRVASNALYQIFCSTRPLTYLKGCLDSGLLDIFVRRFGQRYSGGNWRYTATLLRLVRIPSIDSLSSDIGGAKLDAVDIDELTKWMQFTLGATPSEWARLAGRNSNSRLRTEAIE